MGLALPVDHLELFAYIPDGNAAAQCRFVTLYSQSYEYTFPKEVLDATLKIGSGRTADYRRPWGGNPPATAYVVEGEILFSDAGVGFVDVKGVGGGWRNPASVGR